MKIRRRWIRVFAWLIIVSYGLFPAQASVEWWPAVRHLSLMAGVLVPPVQSQTQAPAGQTQTQAPGPGGPEKNGAAAGEPAGVGV